MKCMNDNNWRYWLSAMLKKMAVNGKVVSFDDIDLRKCYGEIHKIGVNINQITAMINQTKSVYKNDADNLNKEFSKIKNSMET